MSRIRFAAVSIAIAGGVLLAHAQTPANPQQPSPVFRAGVEVVNLDMRVVDADGRPVTDLKPSEVVIEEGGRPRPIVLFQHVAAPTGSYLDVARRTIGAEVSTNQGAPRGHLYVFVFDQNHITPGNEQRARLAAEHFLKTRVKPGDRVALYAIPGPGPQLPLSPNVTLALSELPRVRGTLDRQVGVGTTAMSLFEAYQIARGDQGIAQRILTRSTEGASAATADVSGRTATTRTAAGGTTGVTNTGDSFTQQVQLITDAARAIVQSTDAESRAFLASLADVIRELAKVEGRKTVLLVSEGFHADNINRDVDQVAAAASEAYAVVYALDINRRGIDVSSDAPAGAEPASEVQSRIESLGALAAETSGELVLDAGPQMDRVLTRVVETSQDYYVVGFEPPGDALNNRHSYRRIKVSVTRPGARVTSRTGYSLRDAQGPADRRRSIDAALAAPFTQQGLPLQMTTYVLRGQSPGAQRVFASLQAELPIGAADKTTTADVVFVVRGANDGRVMASGTETLPLPKAAEPGRTTAPGRFNVQFDLPSGEYLMRAVVREPGGTTGTVDRRFEVRALDGVDLTASDLIIGPRQDKLPVRPVGYIDEGLVGMMEIYARRTSDLENADVTLDLFRVGDERPVRSVKPDLGNARAVGSGAARAVTVAMPLTGVEPGEYVARATVRAHGETAAQVVRQVQVVPGRAQAVAAVAEERVTPLMMVNGELGKRLQNQVKATSKDAGTAKALEAAARGAWDESLAALGAAGANSAAGTESLRGLALFALGRFPEAGEAMQRALALDPRSSLDAFFLGWIQIAGGRSADAISAWRQAITIDPTLVSAYLALADTYVRLSHPELASEALKQGLRAVPGSVELRARLDEVERR